MFDDLIWNDGEIGDWVNWRLRISREVWFVQLVKHGDTFRQTDAIRQTEIYRDLVPTFQVVVCWRRCGSGVRSTLYRVKLIGALRASSIACVRRAIRGQFVSPFT
jgi:hypothetical protein